MIRKKRALSIRGRALENNNKSYRWSGNVGCYKNDSRWQARWKSHAQRPLRGKWKHYINSHVQRVYTCHFYIIIVSVRSLKAILVMSKKKGDEMLRNVFLSRSIEQIYQTIPSLTYIEKTRKRARIHYWWSGKWLATKAFCYTNEDSSLTQNDFVG